MAIRVRVPEATAGLVHVAPAPLAEALLSLHVLLHPKENPLQHPWIRRMRTLSPGLKREIRTFCFLYSDITADFVLPASADSSQSFEEALAAFASMPQERAQYEIARPVFFYREEDAGGPECMARDDLREKIRATMAAWGAWGEALASDLLDDPASVQARIVDMLAAYWAESFAAEWERLEPALAEEAERARRDDPVAMLEATPSELKVDAAERVLYRWSLHEHEVTVEPSNPLRLIPSVYVWPHVRVNCDAPWPLAVLYPPRTMRNGVGRRRAPDALVRGLRATADPTRLKILRLVGEEPRSTEELAPLVGLSESGLSKHLRALVDAGLLSTRRQGWYVLYELDRGRLARLGPDLLDYVG